MPFPKTFPKKSQNSRFLNFSWDFWTKIHCTSHSLSGAMNTWVKRNSNNDTKFDTQFAARIFLRWWITSKHHAVSFVVAWKQDYSEAKDCMARITWIKDAARLVLGNVQHSKLVLGEIRQLTSFSKCVWRKGPDKWSCVNQFSFFVLSTTFSCVWTFQLLSCFRYVNMFVHWMFFNLCSRACIVR